jgi:SPP1 family predicted phage head-tail adaptor
MKPVNYDRQITLSRTLEVADARGALIKTTSAYLICWAALTKQGSGEAYRDSAGKVVATTTLTMQMRYSAAVRVDDTLSIGGVDYNITGIDEIGRREGLILTLQNLS